MIDARKEQFQIILDKVHHCKSRMLEGEFPDETVDYYEGVDVHTGVYGGVINVSLERDNYQKMLFSIDVDAETLCYLYDEINGDQVIELTSGEDVLLGDFTEFKKNAEELIEAFICGNFHLLMVYLQKASGMWREQLERYLNAADELPDRHNLYI